jgi:hypothetical protein
MFNSKRNLNFKSLIETMKESYTSNQNLLLNTSLSPVHNAHVCVFDGTYYKMMLNDIGVAITLFILNKKSSMNPFLPVHLTIHITKLHLPTTFPKPLYIRHSACIYRDPGR